LRSRDNVRVASGSATAPTGRLVQLRFRARGERFRDCGGRLACAVAISCASRAVFATAAGGWLLQSRYSARRERFSRRRRVAGCCSRDIVRVASGFATAAGGRLVQSRYGARRDFDSDVSLLTPDARLQTAARTA
jgi:hypothetical protein